MLPNASVAVRVFYRVILGGKCMTRKYLVCSTIPYCCCNLDVLKVKPHLELLFTTI